MKNVLIISPHLDDAVLSCGDLIDKFIDDKYNVDILTIFSKDVNKKDLSNAAIKFHSNCFLPNNPMKYRKIEDKKAHKYLKCNSFYLNKLECLYRKKNNKFLYPNLDEIYHFEKEDTEIVETLEKELSKIINSYDIVLAPLGLGNHADHLVCNKAINNIKNKIKNELYFYEEVAYVCYYYRKNAISNWGDNLNSKIIKLSDKNFTKKINSILFYKSQLNILWNNYNQMYKDLEILSKKYDCERSIRLWYYENLQ